MPKVYRAYRPGSFKSLDFERHRYLGITSAELAERLERFQKVLGDDSKLQLDQIHNKILESVAEKWIAIEEKIDRFYRNVSQRNVMQVEFYSSKREC